MIGRDLNQRTAIIALDDAKISTTPSSRSLSGFDEVSTLRMSLWIHHVADCQRSEPHMLSLRIGRRLSPTQACSRLISRKSIEAFWAQRFASNRMVDPYFRYQPVTHHHLQSRRVMLKQRDSAFSAIPVNAGISSRDRSV